MRILQHHGLFLCLVLATSVATGEEHHPVERNLFLSDHPRNEVPSIYVGGRIATLLRFEKPCDPARTTMLGWEGRFEPLLVGGKSVVLVPLHDLGPEDRFMLRVTLSDGTELPFTVTALKQTYGDRRVDQQVNVYSDPKGYNAVLSSLDDALQRERDLSAENERYKKEEASVDHAFAALLVNGAVRQTPFVQDQKWLLNDGTVEMVVRVYAGKAKAAVVFQITNQSSDRPWKLKEARLSSVGTWKSRPFALRMNQPEIAPGAVGTLAVVADRSAFALETGRVDLNLELFREDGLRQAFVLLDHRLAHE